MVTKTESIIAEFKNAIKKQDFYVYVQSAHEDGRLKAIMPDVDKLFAVKERIDSGEICTVDKQMSAALKRGDMLSAKCKYALLLYNVSKAYTSGELQPMHPFNYGIRSVGIIDKISGVLNMPESYNEFAKIFARYHTMMHNPNDINDSEAYNLAIVCDNLGVKEDFFSCARVYMACKAERATDGKYVLECAKASEERLRNIFYQIKSGDDAEYSKCTLEEALYGCWN